MIQIRGSLSITTRQGKRGAFNVGVLSCGLGQFIIKDALIDEYDAGTYSGDFTVSKIFISSNMWQGRLFQELRAQVTAVQLHEVDAAIPELQSEPDPLDEAPPVSVHVPVPVPVTLQGAVTEPSMSPKLPMPPHQVKSSPATQTTGDTLTVTLSAVQLDLLQAQQANQARDKVKQAAKQTDKQMVNQTTFTTTASPPVASLNPQRSSIRTQLLDEETWLEFERHQTIKLDASVDRERLRQQRDFLKASGYRFNPLSQVWHYAELPIAADVGLDVGLFAA